jgi:hypothetical protein
VLCDREELQPSRKRRFLEQAAAPALAHDPPRVAWLFTRLAETQFAASGRSSRGRACAIASWPRVARAATTAAGECSRRVGRWPPPRLRARTPRPHPPRTHAPGRAPEAMQAPRARARRARRGRGSCDPSSFSTSTTRGAAGGAFPEQLGRASPASVGTTSRSLRRSPRARPARVG